MKIVAKTDIGNQRSENQDNYRAGRQPDETVWALVCDGMGGAQGGKLASGIASATMEELFAANIDTIKNPEDMKDFIFSSIKSSNERIHQKSMQSVTERGMGTTLVCAVMRDNLIQYAHVGDSRAYLYRDGTLLQLTCDHSMVQQLIEEGRITEEEAATHPNKNLITRALGVSPSVEVDYGEAYLAAHDIILLCTDGLTNYVTDDEIAYTLENTQFYDTADVLVQQALDGGGLDNVTVLLVEAEPLEDTRG